MNDRTSQDWIDKAEQKLIVLGVFTQEEADQMKAEGAIDEK